MVLNFFCQGVFDLAKTMDLLFRKIPISDFASTLGKSQSPGCPFIHHWSVCEPVLSLVHIACYVDRFYVIVESIDWMDPKRETVVPADVLGENKDTQSVPCFILSWIFLLEYGDCFLFLLLGLCQPLYHPLAILKHYVKNVFSTTLTLELLASSCKKCPHSMSCHSEINK